MTDFATNTFKCPECGNTKFYCYPQTVIVGKQKHDWEYTCTKCKCVTVLRTVDWRVKNVLVDCDEGRICPKCGKVMILCEDEKTYNEIWECDGCGHKEAD